MIRRSFVIFIILGSLVSCTKKETSENPKLTPAQMVEHGQKVFQLNCVSCHGGDPTKDGPVGPAIAGSSLELITARVLKTEYPQGYKPKRTSHNMVALPHLQADLPALEAYLNSVK